MWYNFGEVIQMDSITILLHDAVANESPYHPSALEDRVCHQLDQWIACGGPAGERFHDDLMELLAQYQERGFVLGLKSGLMLAGELFCRKAL